MDDEGAAAGGELEPDWVMPDLAQRFDTLWELAALARAWGGEPGNALTDRATRVADLHGFIPAGSTVEQRATVVEAIRAQLELAASLADGTSQPGWNPPADATLQSQGKASRRIAEVITKILAVDYPALGELLAVPGAQFLDIGVGVAQISLGMCAAYPQLRCVGLDVNERPLKLAATNIAEEGRQSRIELRRQSVADLTDIDTYTLAWVPLPFLPAQAARDGLRAILPALRPGGWIVAGCHEADADERTNAMTWLQATVLGGNHFTSVETVALLDDLGYTAITQPPSLSGAPDFILARRASD